MNRNVLTTLLVVVGLAALSWFLRRVLPRIITRYIDNKVDQRFKLALIERQAELNAEQATRQDAYTKELERLKSELQREADTIKHRQQRELTDFGLFTTKRHEIYSTTYTMLRRVLELLGLAELNRSKTPDYGSMDAAGLAFQLSRFGLSDEWKGSIMAASLKWPPTKRGELAFSAVREALLKSHNQAVIQTLGFIHSNALYYSPDVMRHLDGIAAEFNAPVSDEWRESAWISALLKGLKERMQYDISGGAISPEQNAPTPSN